MTREISSICIIALAFCAGLSAQQRFDSPEAAAQAIIDTTRAHDSAKLNIIFGLSVHDILTSGDPKQDQMEQDEFSKLAAAKHQIQPDPRDPNRAILTVGDEDWPFPVPLVRAKDKWTFDASETPAEMRARRIGTDELDAISVCNGYVDAQQQYASEKRDGDGLPKYAAHITSTPGHHDGLYWEDANPPLVPKEFAEATAASVHSKPYHGYYFRILDAQGQHAHGGAYSYVAGKRLMGGFGLVAWPARYGVTGIHTFIVNQDGVVYEKDAPPVTDAATPLTKFDPDDSWSPVD